jgi:predicted Rossmann fold nucleotide-binding protein DprA/Smf involved in DNA uptake
MSTTLRDPREIIREEPLMHHPILAALKAGPLTVPEIAEQIGHPSDEVLFWVMGMRRYGHVVEVEDPTDEGYFRYASVRQEATS